MVSCTSSRRLRRRSRSVGPRKIGPSASLTHWGLDLRLGERHKCSKESGHLFTFHSTGYTYSPKCCALENDLQGLQTPPAVPPSISMRRSSRDHKLATAPTRLSLGLCQSAPRPPSRAAEANAINKFARDDEMDHIEICPPDVTLTERRTCPYSTPSTCRDSRR